MSQWWAALTALQRVFACVALPATFILVIQTVMVLFGLGDHDMDTDGGFDTGGVDIDDGAALDGIDDGGFNVDDAPVHDGGQEGHGDGLALFSVRGIVAFFAVGGWAGIVAAGMKIPAVLAVLIAWACGSAALYGIALLFRFASRLQSAGNMSLHNAVGKTASVYITIPGGRRGTGKVTLTFQGRFTECDAVTDAPSDLKTGTAVDVVDLADENTLLVTPVTETETKSDEVEEWK
jgi:hypothetical protein